MEPTNRSNTRATKKGVLLEWAGFIEGWIAQPMARRVYWRLDVCTSMDNCLHLYKRLDGFCISRGPRLQRLQKSHAGKVAKSCSLQCRRLMGRCGACSEAAKTWRTESEVGWWPRLCPKARWQKSVLRLYPDGRGHDWEGALLHRLQGGMREQMGMPLPLPCFATCIWWVLGRSCQGTDGKAAVWGCKVRLDSLDRNWERYENGSRRARQKCVREKRQKRSKIHMKTHENPWRPMKTHEDPWRPMKTHEDPWIHMNFHEFLWIPLISNGNLWSSTKTCLFQGKFDGWIATSARWWLDSHFVSVLDGWIATLLLLWWLDSHVGVCCPCQID